MGFFFEKNAAKIVKEFTNDDINNFNLDNTYDFWQQVLNNKKILLIFGQFFCMQQFLNETG